MEMVIAGRRRSAIITVLFIEWLCSSITELLRIKVERTNAATGKQCSFLRLKKALNIYQIYNVQVRLSR